MASCFITQPIHFEGIECLRAAGIVVRIASSADMTVVRREICDAEAVITRDAGLSGEAMRAAPRLRLIASHGIGTNRIDLLEARQQHIVVTNTPATNVRSVAEHTIGMMLALARRVTEADQAVRCGDWAFRYTTGFIELKGKCLGLAGFGQIAQEVARIARAGFGMEVMAWSPGTPDERFAQLCVVRASSLQDLLAGSNVVSLHRPLRADTVNMIDEAALRVINPGALLINVGRGGLVDIRALDRALRDGRVGAAALDVFTTEPPGADDPVMLLPRTILTPHLGGTTKEALVRTAILCATQVMAVLKGETPPHVVQLDG